jgi:hypothetical protein
MNTSGHTSGSRATDHDGSADRIQEVRMQIILHPDLAD